MRSRIVFLCLFAVGCAASAPAYAPPLGVALQCVAETATTCPRLGCRAPGPQTPSRLSLSVPAQGELGRYCVAETCQDARMRPTMTRALGWTADLSVGAGLTRPLGEVEIGPERRTFVLRQQNARSMYVWSGLCTPSGP